MRKRKNIVFISIVSLLILVVFLSGCIFSFGGKIYEYIDAEFETNENTVLEVSNIKYAPGVQGQAGEYFWTVVVQITPDYQDMQIQADPTTFYLQ